MNGCPGANPNAHLPDVNRCSECSGVRKEVEQDVGFNGIFCFSSEYGLLDRPLYFSRIN